MHPSVDLIDENGGGLRRALAQAPEAEETQIVRRGQGGGHGNCPMFAFGGKANLAWTSRNVR